MYNRTYFDYQINDMMDVQQDIFRANETTGLTLELVDSDGEVIDGADARPVGPRRNTAHSPTQPARHMRLHQ